MLRYLDFFAGVGGISLGLKAAGFSRVGVVKMDDRAAASYRFNFPDHTDEAALIRLGAAEGDARLLKSHQVSLHPRVLTSAAGELDLLVAGYPCQGFSHIQTQAFGDR
jgi:DNA (cytosine-5)-methyltransferase 1